MPRLHFHLISFTLACSMILLLGSCSLLPRSEFTQPQVTLPTVWQQHQAVDGVAIADEDAWWKSFNDPLLDQLIDRALRSNNNLEIGRASCRERV